MLNIDLNINQAIDFLNIESNRISTFRNALLLCEDLLTNYNYRVTLDRFIIIIEFDSNISRCIRMYFNYKNELCVSDKEFLSEYNNTNLENISNKLLELIKRNNILSKNEELIKNIIE